MEIMLSTTPTTSATEQTDAAARPADDGAGADGGFDLLLAMALQAVPLATAPVQTVGEPSAPDASESTSAAAQASDGVAGDQATPSALASALPPAEPLPPAAASSPLEPDSADAAGAAPALDATIGDAEKPGENAPRGRALDVSRLTTSSTAPEMAIVEPRGIESSGSAETETPGASADVSQAHTTPSRLQSRSTDSDGGNDRPGSDPSFEFEGTPAEAAPVPGSNHRVEPSSDGFAAMPNPATGVSASAALHAGTAHAAAPAVIPQLVEGLHLAFERGGSGVHLQLHPEGLGSVDLRVVSGEAGLAIRIAIENPATCDMIQAAVGQLAQSIEGRGLAVAHLLVDLAANQGGQGEMTRQTFEHSTSAGFLGGTTFNLGPETEAAAADASAAAVYRIDYRV